MAIKEMWVYLLAYNLIRLMMAQAAVLSNLLPRQLSFKHTVQMWIAWTAQTAMIIVLGSLSLLFLSFNRKRYGTA